MLDTASPFPQYPPSLKIEDYFCPTCGGLHRLPDQLLFEPIMLRWCICHWSTLQQFFARAADYYAGVDDEEKKVDTDFDIPSHLWAVEKKAKEPA